jgi:hypothetical protein
MPLARECDRDWNAGVDFKVLLHIYDEVAPEGRTSTLLLEPCKYFAAQWWEDDPQFLLTDLGSNPDAGQRPVLFQLRSGKNGALLSKSIAEPGFYFNPGCGNGRILTAGNRRRTSPAGTGSVTSARSEARENEYERCAVFACTFA